MRLRKFLLNSSGSVTVYATLFTMVAVGAGALALDFGRMTLLRAEMQNRADAGAMAAARFLDGSDGSRAIATDVAVNAMTQISGVNAEELDVSAVLYYSSLSPLTEATSDLNAKFVHVKLNAKNMNLFFAPVLNMLANPEAPANATQSAQAIAGPKPFLCHAPPLMICDFLENSPPTNLRNPDNAGRMIVLKEPQGGGSWAPGNFGLLSLPDGSGGAKDIEGALAAVAPEDCYSIDVETAQGSKTNKVKDGVNARFDLPGNPWPYPAPNVINYPRDNQIIADSNIKLGDGYWNIASYWSTVHAGDPLPLALAEHDGRPTSRLQVYLYELGETFWRKGNQTIYPIPADTAIPEGFVEVAPAAADVPRSPSNPHDNTRDGEPSQEAAPNGAKRRFAQVAQLQCVADNVHGNGTYPTNGNYIEIFITEFVPDPPEAAIYGEIIRPLNPSNHAEYHSNVELF
ncbi:pilus assembly protein TadG-related protein [Sneathiella chinensis]|uniref:Putative Flp pilus-assembly TadG-like N-terminal domain-containing protein n=1 Tax=Sneathiella chinensis TaxID=349750 RepID=A0ABQ5U6H1_9PROT|nr:pilus assembly protein TadG-related protein [Sneathiella chinensis]GLQ07381.1 hypothetical protein GCM10007924_26020 [Sneathiella chinensis]